MKKVFWMLVLLFGLLSCELQELKEEPCGQGQIKCGSVCVNPLDNDNCGGCAIRCEEGTTCMTTTTGTQCMKQSVLCDAEDQIYCGRNVGCVRPDSNDHCGSCNPCVKPEQCVKGEDGKYACVNQCRPPKIQCGTTCIMPNTVESCGSCNACLPGQFCNKISDVEYQCEDSCQEPKKVCNGTCMMPDTNEHCGNCDTKCFQGFACEASGEGFSCQDSCKAPRIVCGDRCIMPNTKSNCGTCDNVCENFEKCTEQAEGQFACTSTCVAPKIICGDKCITPNTVEHCGSCNKVCKNGYMCVVDESGFNCKNSCEPPYMICGSDCILPNTKDNCGTCGRTCKNYEECTKKSEGKYACVSTCTAPRIICNSDCILPNTNEHCGSCNPCDASTSDCVESNTGFRCVDRCHNGKKDLGEDYVDCGGNCAPCKKCRQDGDDVFLCADGLFCDLAVGAYCMKKCVPDSGEYNTPSKDCPGKDRICRADGRCSSKYFIAKWTTGGTYHRSLTYYYTGGGKGCHLTIEWGDGKSSAINCTNDGDETHYYENGGTYTVRVSGKNIGGLRRACYYSNDQLRQVYSFGPVGIGEDTFENCRHGLIFSKDDVPDATKLTNAYEMFRGAKIDSDISHWDVSNMTNADSMFYGATMNQDLSNWNINLLERARNILYNVKGMSQENKNKTLNSWKKQKPELTFE